QQGEAAVAAKKAEVAQERAAITQDQKTVIAAQVAAQSAAAAAGVYLIQIVDPTTHLGRIVFVDTGSGDLIRASRVNAIHPRSLVDDGSSFVGIAGLAGRPGGARLVRFDKTSLQDVADSSAEVFPEGTILSSGGAFYAPVPGSGGALYLARFDASLKETARSNVEVEGYAVLAAGAGGIIAQEKSGAFAVLRADSLELVKELKP
ncbi:MAG: P83/100 family protein, partial [Treponema sp.]|nr:P83/100 family protein [Treponema sp.]